MGITTEKYLHHYCFNNRREVQSIWLLQLLFLNLSRICRNFYLGIFLASFYFYSLRLS